MNKKYQYLCLFYMSRCESKKSCNKLWGKKKKRLEKQKTFMKLRFGKVQNYYYCMPLVRISQFPMANTI